MKISYLIFWYLLALNSLGQSMGQSNDTLIEEERQFAAESSLPESLLDFYSKKEFNSKYNINKNLNPFYLRGDFDGDNMFDYALAIIDLESRKKGFLIFHPSTKKYFIVGAGTTILGGQSDDLWMIDAWEVYEKRTVERGATDAKPPILIGEAILAKKLEASSGLIYWNGKDYRWYQQGD